MSNVQCVKIEDCEALGLIGGPFAVKVLIDGRCIARRSGIPDRFQALVVQEEMAQIYGCTTPEFAAALPEVLS